MKNAAVKSLQILAITGLLVSCGSKSDKKDGGNSYLNQGYTSQAEANTVSSVKSGLPCQNGKRLSRDYVYFLPFQGNHTKICGTPQQGSQSGSTGNIFVGVSAFNDIMTVTEVVSGNRVVGHNIRLSMCSQYMQSAYGALPLIADERPLSNFKISQYNCIILDKDNFCPHGVVDSAQNTYQVSAPYQYNYNGMSMQLNPYEVWTTFFKPGCSQKY